MARRPSPAQGRFDLPVAEPHPDDRPHPSGRSPRSNTSTQPADQPDLFSVSPPRPTPPPAPQRASESVRFTLSPVRIRQFIAAAGSNTIDHWLYYCTDDDAIARTVLENGLTPDPDDPPTLREAGAVTSWLARFDEDSQDDPDGGEPVIFRLRRSIVREAIEPDPDAPQQPGKRHYLLAGDRQDD
ncbi:hypothetical protein [Acetobacter oeni]|uniref:Uncharacterized protein n=1 Tax=Acetobacter oeni TaxID=304077 RepID=A0A511XM37_9PROT|nr:hypothetical protein [Acetobacter oeni]MBB3884015.1 hypothetical protein [Acetobacter oeni]NHO20073.1 hypothetical protein [Acetobacter oeni]GBR03749.1 hypothetical protein AA21952_1157 [Acetobacter oeni LMG 21952]GEN64004.1 hypothetical protein AOE01nite_22280 [Acetobacter oeni]